MTIRQNLQLVLHQTSYSILPLVQSIVCTQKIKKLLVKGLVLFSYHLACPLNYCTKQTTMQIQALNLVLTSLHKGVSKFKNIEQKGHHSVIKTYLGAGVHSCCREEGRDSTHPQGSLRLAQVPAEREGTEQPNNLCVPWLLQGCPRAPAPAGSVPQGTTLQRVCQAAAALQLNVPHHAPNCSVLLQAHLSAPFV